MKIVVAEPAWMADDVRKSLADIGEVVSGPFTDEAFLRAISDAEVLMVRLGRFVSEAAIAHAPRLRFIVTATTGLDHIDLDAASVAGVRVISLRDCADQIQDVSATAELTWALLLSLVRAIPAANAHVGGGGWDRNRFWGTQLKGKCLGIIGHGRIGSMVAAYGVAFGMDVVAYDVVPTQVRPPARAVPLDQLIQISDVISVHVTADPRNHRLVNQRLLSAVKAGAILLNTTRGSILDSQAVADALATGRLAGVAVDVLDGEERGHASHDPLVSAARAGQNVVITPHIGGATRESIAIAERAVVAELARAVARPGTAR